MKNKHTIFLQTILLEFVRVCCKLHVEKCCQIAPRAYSSHEFRSQRLTHLSILKGDLLAAPSATQLS